MDNRINRLVPNPGASLFVLFGSYVFFLCALSFLGEWMLPRFSDSQKGLRLLFILQSIFVFIVPTLIAALTGTRLPARLLCIEHRPRLIPALITISILLVSIPAMEYIIKLNSEMRLPDSMASLEQKMQSLEENANTSLSTLIGTHTIVNLIMSILIVGMLGPLGEELFFRGALQRLIGQTQAKGQIAVWITAVIFSAIHLQFYGFIPRLLLGAFFGYLLLWSGNLWLPVIAHCFNNTLASFVAWKSQAEAADAIEKSSDAINSSNIPLVATSSILTVIGIYILFRYLKKESSQISY